MKATFVHIQVAEDLNNVDLLFQSLFRLYRVVFKECVYAGAHHLYAEFNIEIIL